MSYENFTRDHRISYEMSLLKHLVYDFTGNFIDKSKISYEISCEIP